MKYSIFDTLGNNKSYNKIIIELKKEALTFSELADKTELDRTSVFYHIKNLEKQGKIKKHFIGRTVYIGLIEEMRSKKQKIGGYNGNNKN